MHVLEIPLLYYKSKKILLFTQELIFSCKFPPCAEHLSQKCLQITTKLPSDGIPTSHNKNLRSIETN